MRASAVLAACCLIAWCGVASADAIDKNVRDLKSDSYKVRLSGMLALAKSRDARAVIALADAVVHDEDATIRKLSALALEKMVDDKSEDDARELALGALERAESDPDPKVAEAAKRVFKSLEGYRKKRGAQARESHGRERESSSGSGSGPAVFVNVDTVQDQTKKLPSGGADRLSSVVKKTVERTGYSTSWGSGGLPSSQELGKTRGFIVASTVKTIDITHSGHQTQIACTVQIRVAPWGGRDAGERWEANKAASATGSAKATTGEKDKDIASGVKDCIEAVGEDVTQRQVVPFLKKLAAM